MGKYLHPRSNDQKQFCQKSRVQYANRILFLAARQHLAVRKMTTSSASSSGRTIQEKQTLEIVLPFCTRRCTEQSNNGDIDLMGAVPILYDIIKYKLLCHHYNDAFMEKRDKQGT